VIDLTSADVGRKDAMRILRVSLSSGVNMIVERLPPAPEALALSMFIKELYSKKFVERHEVIQHVKELLLRVKENSDQYERLIEIRKEFCGNKEIYNTFAELFESIAGVRGYEDIALANYAIIKVLLAQCNPKWESLDIDKKAEILAPLYMALYHLDKYQKTKHLRHLRSAVTLALESLNALEDIFGEPVDRIA
jgi:hypothetical protein